LPRLAGEGSTGGYCTLQLLRAETIRLEFGLSELAEFYPDAGVSVRTSASSVACGSAELELVFAEVAERLPASRRYALFTRELLACDRDFLPEGSDVL